MSKIELNVKNLSGLVFKHIKGQSGAYLWPCVSK